MTEAQIRDFIGRSDLKEFLISINPQVETLWSWFERLQREVLAGLTPDSVEADTPPVDTDETTTDATPPTPAGDTPADT